MLRSLNVKDRTRKPDHKLLYVRYSYINSLYNTISRQIDPFPIAEGPLLAKGCAGKGVRWQGSAPLAHWLVNVIQQNTSTRNWMIVRILEAVQSTTTDRLRHAL